MVQSITTSQALSTLIYFYICYIWVSGDINMEWVNFLCKH